MAAKRTKSIREERVIPTYDQKVRALFDFWAFVDLIQFRGGKKAFGDCHYDLINWADTHEKDRELVLMPRGHLKSTLMSVARKLHRIYQNPNIRIYVGTSTRFLATAFVRQIKQYLEDPFLQEHVWNDRPHVVGRLVPLMDRASRSRRNDLGDTEAQDKKVVWRSDAIQVLRSDIMSEPTVVVGSVGSTATGFHFDEMVLDDVITYENINTPEKRESLMSWIYDLESVLDPPVFDEGLHKQFLDCIEEWRGRVRGSSKYEKEFKAKAKKLSWVGGRLSVVGTRYDIDDYYGVIEDRRVELDFAVYSKNIYVNGQDSTAGYIWPEKWDDVLEKKTRTAMTSQRFASQYLNQILARENQVLVFDNIIGLHPGAIRMKKGDRLVTITHGTFPDGETVIRPYLVIDPAASNAEKADFTAIAVGGRDKHGNLIILDLDVGHFSAMDILDHTYALADKWQINALNIEVVGGFKHLLEFFRTNFSKYRPIGLIEYRPQGDKILRIGNMLQPLIENQMMYMSAYLKNNRIIENSFNFFPRKSVKDDPPDVCAILAEIAKAPTGKNMVNRLLEVNKLWGGVR